MAKGRKPVIEEEAKKIRKNLIIELKENGKSYYLISKVFGVTQQGAKFIYTKAKSESA